MRTIDHHLAAGVAAHGAPALAIGASLGAPITGLAVVGVEDVRAHGTADFDSLDDSADLHRIRVR